MTALDLDALEAVAKAATPGPWYATHHTEAPSIYAKPEHQSLSYGIAQTTTITLQGASPSPGPANAAHIATFDPPTVVALIARLRQAEAENERLREVRP